MRRRTSALVTEWVQSIGHCRLTPALHCGSFLLHLLQLYGDQLGGAAGVLKRNDSIFRGELAHQQRKVAIGSHQDGGAIEPLYVLSCLKTATADLDHELAVCHCLFSLGIRIRQFAIFSADTKQRSLVFGMFA